MMSDRQDMDRRKLLQRAGTVAFVSAGALYAGTRAASAQVPPPGCTPPICCTVPTCCVCTPEP